MDEEPRYSLFQQITHGGPLVILGYLIAFAFLVFALLRFTQAVIARKPLDGFAANFAWIPLGIGVILTCIPICLVFPMISRTRGIAEYPAIEIMLGRAFAPAFHGALSSLLIAALALIAAIFRKRA